MSGPTPVESVYVHAPFCARRCGYCDFAVTVRATGDTDAWLAAIRAELGLLDAEGLCELAPTLATLYVGGGTPSLLGADAMDGLASAIGADRLRAPELEWTAEANPESFTEAIAAGWRRAGVNRLSLGAQSFDDRVLRWMGRLHGADGPARAVRAARDVGLASISVDLIFALPEGVERDWRADLEHVLRLDVPHVSLYGLTIEAGTPLGRRAEEGRVHAASDERYRDEYLLAVELLTGAGYEHYEVSNFARPGHRSRHNTVYWAGDPYLGLGNGAHSYAPPVRRWNVRSWESYREAVAGGRLPEAEREEPVGEALELERIWLGLRADDGVSVPSERTRGRALVEGWKHRGWARLDGSRVRLTAEGWLLLDELAVSLQEALAAPTD